MPRPSYSQPPLPSVSGGTLRHIISPECPGTTLEPRPSRAYQERLTKEVPRIRYPNHLDWLRSAGVAALR